MASTSSSWYNRHRSYAQNQQAIEYARAVWKLDIITLASGFNQPHQLMQEEIRKACHQGILIFAAASNEGNTQFITFPANLASVSEAICMFATSANGKGYHELDQPISEPEKSSGTSMATFIGAATAALILDFARQSDVAEIIGSQRGAYLSSVGGMSAVFRRMAEGGSEAGYDCMAPWKLQSYFPQSREKHKVSIAHAISDALDKRMV
ncbi:hypothetical protein HFD88_008311 [Aspergillus terreus]|nr:hypothetical protein HFD88_008311 [Aspergillus terreus]